VRIHTAAVPPFMKNGFLVACAETAQAVIIDPGDEVDELLTVAREWRVTVNAILLTHAHFDHITGVGRAKAETGAPVWLHQDDQFLYDGIVEQAMMFGLHADRQPPVDRFYAADSALGFGRCAVEWYHTPGHCPGGICLAIGPAASPERHLFVGDTLFAGSIGRTDLPGGSHSRLLSSIQLVLFRFPDQTVVHPGHGPETTIGRERATNPYLMDRA
jgi:glyoxylase-like metal-dependent hydrolase (beta-lactamase superfamily II)